MVGAAAFGFLAQAVAYLCMTGQPMVIPEVNTVRLKVTSQFAG